MARKKSLFKKTEPSAPVGSDSAPAPSAADQIDIAKKLGGLPAPAGTPAQAVLWNVPQHYASSLTAYVAGNDFVVTLLRPRPAAMPGIPEGSAAAIAEPVAVLHFSPGTMKDLYLITKTQIEAYEKEYGKIETEFSRRTEQKK